MDVLCFWFLVLAAGVRSVLGFKSFPEETGHHRAQLRLGVLFRVSQLYSMNTWDPNLKRRCQLLTLDTIAVL